MTRSFSALPRQNKTGGFLLLELVISIFITTVLLTLLIRCICQLLPLWNRIYVKTNLYNAGHYMLSILEKNLAYDAAGIILTKDNKGRAKLVCQTTKGNQSFSFTCDNERIYKTITKHSSSGTNPLYVSDCKVTSWQITKLNNSQIRIHIHLAQNGQQVILVKSISCLNGRID